MRKEAFSVGSYVHVTQRGTRGFPIVRDRQDRDRFLLMLAHFNDEFTSLNWYRDVHNSLNRPEHWPERKPLTNILAFSLVENHFHLILEESTEGGISRFMQRLGTGIAKKFNERYTEKGSLFQGPYHARTISDDRYLRYVSVYVQVKNGFDVYPGGTKAAMKNFERAYEWLAHYPYTSLGDYAGSFDRPIVQAEFLSSLLTPHKYKDFAKDVMLGCYGRDDVMEAHQSSVFE